MTGVHTQSLARKFGQDCSGPFPFGKQIQTPHINGAPGNKLRGCPEHLRAVKALQLAYGDNQLFVWQIRFRRGPESSSRRIGARDYPRTAGIRNVQQPVFQAIRPG